ncbi:3-isopropylmalate dehydratase [candidate division KD3-62 bacterium DG_56]|uniref:3-isopropylmalate dehydratase small subunit n=1 Tax=candidate division KD3-62 bacterium DG_56 TaxID=1704032 RepID=A0A0S7XPW1_9BACT|nr:MAG: 3-isopropylmalate dehydratase [candidate division KD3-62 bacterium DG_56]
MTLRGKVWKYGDHVDTDVIIPARYLDTTEPAELAAHCLEDIDPAFVRSMSPGDIIVGGENFGCGSSREQAPVAIKAAGVSCVIARSFARIFFRNAINIGLPIIICPDAADAAGTGDEIEVDLATGTVRNVTRGTTHQAEPFPDFLRQIIDAGGLVPYVRQRLAER